MTDAAEDHRVMDVTVTSNAADDADRHGHLDPYAGAYL